MNNLNNLSDDELDKLFRQSAEESDVEFDEGAWQKMNSLLDEKQPLRSNWRKYSLIILAILFLGSTAVYFGNENVKSETSNLETSNLETGKLGNSDLENEKLGNGELETGELGNAEAGNGNLENGKLGTGEAGSKVIESKDLAKNNDESGRGVPLWPPSQSKSSKPNLKTKNDNANGELENENSSTKKQINILGKSDKSLAENLENNSNITNSNPRVLSGKNKNEINISSKNKLDKEKTADEKDFESSLSSENKTKNRNKIYSKSKEKIALKSDDKNVKNGFTNIQNSENNTVLLKDDTLEINEKFSNDNVKSKNSKGKNTKNKVVLSEKNSPENYELSKSKTENKNNNITDNQSITASNDDVETVIEKTYFQNINLDYLFSKTGYNFKKPTFEVEVNPLKLNLPEPKKVEFYKKGLAIRLAISPDISTISSNKISKIGSNIGGMLEYRFSNKLSIQAGVFRSMKYYDAMPDQYTWIWGYSHDKLVDINAQCKMVDFPINIRYDFLAKGATIFFVGAGATTYKMMSEKYHYNYENNASTTIKHHDWEGKTGTYYSSNLNLSIGLEKYISKNFTIQVEPFAKSPLKSIGFGKVPLITYGMMISGKYPLNNLIKK